MLDELTRVADEGVTDAELNKARNIVLAEFWHELATIDGKASAIGNYEVFHGNYEKLFRLPADMEAATNEDLRAVAARVFRVNNMTVGVLRAPDAEGSQ